MDPGVRNLEIKIKVLEMKLARLDGGLEQIAKLFEDKIEENKYNRKCIHAYKHVACVLRDEIKKIIRDVNAIRWIEVD